MSDILKNLLSSICCCCDWSFIGGNTSVITINARKYLIKRLLGENTLSFTYMVEYQGLNWDTRLYDEQWDKTFTLKKVICPFGDIDSVANALGEIKKYKCFDSKYIMKCIDSQVVQEENGSKTIFILTPFYPMGSIQDLINRNLLDGITRMAERDIIKLMMGVCKGLLCLHDPTTREDMGQSTMDLDSVSMTVSNDAASLLDDTPLEMDLLASSNNKLDSYIHLNIRPSTILLSDDVETPIISDLGASLRGEQILKNDLDVTDLKEWVSNHCNIHYMAPELVNLTKGSVIDCSVDIWSIGCVLFTLMFGLSPFDREEQINGLPLQHNIIKGIYSIPEGTVYSEKLLAILKSCLQVESVMRPTASELLTQLQDV